MRKFDKDRLNQCAAVLHECVVSGDYSFRSCPSECDYVFSAMQRMFSGENEDSFMDVFFPTLRGFDPEKGDFFSYLTTAVKNKDITRFDKGNRIDSFDEKADNDGEKITIQTKDESVDVEQQAQDYAQLERIHLLAADISIEKKKEYSRKKTFCYPPLFFTDMLTVYAKQAESMSFLKKTGRVLTRQRRLTLRTAISPRKYPTSAIFVTAILSRCLSLTAEKRTKTSPAAIFQRLVQERETTKPRHYALTTACTSRISAISPVTPRQAQTYPTRKTSSELCLKPA